MTAYCPEKSVNREHLTDAILKYIPTSKRTFPVLDPNDFYGVHLSSC